jgi:hypothetical protein
MSIKKEKPKKIAPKKGLTDEEFIRKYEAGSVDFAPILSKGLPDLEVRKTPVKSKK